MQKLRNCSGKGSPGKVELNSKFHPRCPRAVALESFDARYFVRLYFECRETNTYPFPGSITSQTAFCSELFDYLDGEVSNNRLRQYKQQKAEAAKSRESKR